MDTSRFEIANFIAEAIKKDFTNLFIHCENELKWLDGIKFNTASQYRDWEWRIKEYREFIHEFTYILHTGNKPSGMKESDFKRTKPIIEALVEKGQLKSTILNIYSPTT
ncbi:hypothetical protein [Chitinophaga ginsengisoli]|uniref:Uncharacterized protein n=1 Tax=Chitinophaga ginsengisoli TaxID=363837 RepID=A0A2P8FXL0_9BACT|nr:hypothetical protein [Chitinophaga ginsengisoli]PSL26452.1 hypothetical protein CLV42_111166 [Chitinophaga ginsengisoli]